MVSAAAWRHSVSPLTFFELLKSVRLGCFFLTFGWICDISISSFRKALVIVMALPDFSSPYRRKRESIVVHREVSWCSHPLSHAHTFLSVRIWLWPDVESVVPWSLILCVRGAHRDLHSLNNELFSFEEIPVILSKNLYFLNNYIMCGLLHKRTCVCKVCHVHLDMSMYNINVAAYMYVQFVMCL